MATDKGNQSHSWHALSFWKIKYVFRVGCLMQVIIVLCSFSQTDRVAVSVARGGGQIPPRGNKFTASLPMLLKLRQRGILKPAK